MPDIPIAGNHAQDLQFVLSASMGSLVAKRRLFR